PPEPSGAGIAASPPSAREGEAAGVDRPDAPENDLADAVTARRGEAASRALDEAAERIVVADGAAAHRGEDASRSLDEAAGAFEPPTDRARPVAARPRLGEPARASDTPPRAAADAPEEPTAGGPTPNGSNGSPSNGSSQGSYETARGEPSEES